MAPTKRVLLLRGLLFVLMHSMFLQFIKVCWTTVKLHKDIPHKKKVQKKVFIASSSIFKNKIREGVRVVLEYEKMNNFVT
jgi:hypothetical protein